MEANNKCFDRKNKFCYVCGTYICLSRGQKKTKINKNNKVSLAYKKFYGFKLIINPWSPNVLCKMCQSSLEGWLRNQNLEEESIKIKYSPKEYRMKWRKPKNHETDCFFCLIDFTRFNITHNKKDISYPNIMAFSKKLDNQNGISSSYYSLSDECDQTLYSPGLSRKQIIQQSDVNDCVRELNLTKEKGEYLISRMKGLNLVPSSIKITDQRNRCDEFSYFFSFEDNMAYCHDIKGLFEKLSLEHNHDDWRLFIDSSTTSLKAVLLHNGNKYPTIPVCFAPNVKESYENVDILLKKINYSDYNWSVCGDFKMINFLIGLQGGYIKYFCFICLWDSRDKINHYKRKNWPLRKDYTPGEYNVANESLVNPKKILMPPLHIKLGLIKQFVKALDKNGSSFKFIQTMFPGISYAKLKEGIFVGPDIRKMLRSEEFKNQMNPLEKKAWSSFEDVVKNFLGNHKSDNYKLLIKNLIKSFQKLGCKMSLKIHLLDSHLDIFSYNMGDFSEEHGERFHQDIKVLEQRYKGKSSVNMLGDYLWGLKRESSLENQKRKSLRGSSSHF